MGRKAKPLQEQVELLQRRGMSIDDPERVRQLLLEIGWYRLSFYWFPFETRYPDLCGYEHRFREGTSFMDAFMLYAFDFNLRNLLLKPLERIETAFRTYLIYHVSMRYPESPHWFADPKVVGASSAGQFERSIYYPLRKKNPEIQRHHKRFPRDRFAPAWKTIEFLTLGTVCNLYDSLTSSALRTDIARHFGVHQDSVFSNYLEILRDLRNICAHGNILYSYRPGTIRRGPATPSDGSSPQNLCAALRVIEHFLNFISERLLEEYRNGIKNLIQEFACTRNASNVLHRISGFKTPRF